MAKRISSPPTHLIDLLETAEALPPLSPDRPEEQPVQAGNIAANRKSSGVPSDLSCCDLHEPPTSSAEESGK